MSKELSTSLLFGNVDEQGHLEQEEWSKELRDADLGFLSRVTEGMDAEISKEAAATGKTASTGAFKTEHAADAEDFADIEETIEVYGEYANATARPMAPLRLQPLQPLQLQPARAEIEAKAGPSIEELFPTFRRDKILKFSQLFAAPVRKPAPPVQTAAARAAKKARIEAVNKVLAQAFVPAFDERLLFDSEAPLPPRKPKDDLYTVIRSMEVPADMLPAIGEAPDVAQDEIKEAAKDAATIPAGLEDRKLYPINTDTWENDIMWEDVSDSENAGKQAMAMSSESLVSSARTFSFNPICFHCFCLASTASAPQRPAPSGSAGPSRAVMNRPDLRVLKRRGPYAIPNFDLECGDWLDQVVWDDEDIPKLQPKGVLINLNDPHIFVELSADARNAYQQRMMAQKRKRQIAAGLRPEPMRRPDGNAINPNPQQPQFTGYMARWPSERFNISNDLYYDFYRRSGRVRQMFGRSHIQHALPALRLQLPFFKRFMSKSELRSLHRPQIRLPLNSPITFSRVKNLKKKKIKGKNVDELMTSTKDITLKDNSNYLLFEYSEEYPPLMSNGAMGSIIANFYRKRDDRDPFVPRLPDGIPTILEQVDASPFFGFGDVFPGQTMQAIKNNLFIAPIFKHEAKGEDFVLIRSSHKNATKFYVRALPRLYCVGQTYPTMEVQPPQSRKIKNYIRDRLKFHSMRFFRRKGRNLKYRVNKIVNSYHQYHEQSLRKHLKDYGEISKNAQTNQMMLTLRPGVQIPSEREMFKLVTPEQTCLFESMRVGQQRLADAGFGTVEHESDEDEDEEDLMDDEVQLAPWNTTKNFLLATQNKGMCKLFGSGDPTGRGEGFSFFRFSMKKMFIRCGASPEEIEAAKNMRTKTGHKFSLVDQQKVYRDEILRIWFSQLQSLSNPEEPDLADEDQQMAEADESDKEIVETDGEDSMPKMIIIDHNQPQPSSEVDSNAMDYMSADTSRATSPLLSQRSNLLLKKLGAEFGEETMTFDTHSVDSSRYPGRQKSLLIRRKVRTEDGEEEWEEEVVSDQRVINAYIKKKKMMELAKSLNPEDSDEVARQKIIDELRKLKRGQGKRSHLTSAPTRRKCRACGQVGHIQSNRVCPLFAERYPDRVKKQKPAPPPPPPAPVKGGDGKITISSAALFKASEPKKEEPKKDGASTSIKDSPVVKLKLMPTSSSANQ
jgi:hypothetical protein